MGGLSKPHWIAVGCFCCGLGCAGAAEVSITSEGDSHLVSAPAYEAIVAPDGCLTSLRVGPIEFFKSAPRIPRGAYLYQDGPLQLATIEQPEEDVIVARSDKGEVRYRFAADSMTWTLTNRTAARMLLVIVFDPAVSAVRGEWGRFYQPPVERSWKRSTWFREGAKVGIQASARLWGPWAGNHQVWQVSIGPNESREVRFTLGPATAEESAEAERVANMMIEPPEDPDGPMWDLGALSEPPRTFPAEGFEAAGVEALYYEGLPFEGAPTRVFAWVGIPEVEPGRKVPGMVLVHGGGGTAFDNWVRLWTSRGYAAISMDTCGCTPGGTHGERPRHEWGGPPGSGGFGQIDWPREDQWTYHAVADAILAHSLLRSLPQVDPERIGVTGISWGGYLTSILAGVGHRFKLAVPVYGCGFYLETTFGDRVRALGDDRAARWMRWWDPSAYLKDATMPMLWVTGSNDFAFWFPALQRSYRLAPGRRSLCIRLRMPHGHGPAGEGSEEIRVFADSILKNGPPLPRITGQGRDGRDVWATYESPVRIVKAELNVTRDGGRWPDRQWEALAARVAPGKITATLPDGVTVYYLNLFDERDLVVSTEHEELQP